VAERNAIRKAWGRMASRGKHSAIVYIVGKPPGIIFDKFVFEAWLQQKWQLGQF